MKTIVIVRKIKYMNINKYQSILIYEFIYIFKLIIIISQIIQLYFYKQKNIIIYYDKINIINFDENNTNLNSNQKPLIHICMALDNKVVYSTLVSMVSALENNNNKKNYLIYYLLLSYDFNRTSIIKFEKLKIKYKFQINYYFIPKIFGGLKGWRKTKSVYYKLIFPLIHPELNRVLYLDGDTLIFKDLYELFNLPFNDNYILGVPSPVHDFPKKFSKKSIVFINDGVTLFNINKIIKDKIIFDFLNFIIKNSNSFRLLEQDAMLYYFSPNIGYLPYEYGMFIIDYNTYNKLNFLTKKKKIRNAINNPSIVHLVLNFRN